MTFLIVENQTDGSIYLVNNIIRIEPILSESNDNNYIYKINTIDGKTHVISSKISNIKVS